MATVLREHGLPVWYSTTHLQGADQWHDEIGRALDRCDWFVVILSPAAVESTWVKHELTFALNDRRYAERIVPVLYRACEIKRLSWVLGGIQRIDFRRKHAHAYRDLLRVWGISYRG
jgi:hypothetical protein